MEGFYDTEAPRYRALKTVLSRERGAASRARSTRPLVGAYSRWQVSSGDRGQAPFVFTEAEVGEQRHLVSGVVSQPNAPSSRLVERVAEKLHRQTQCLQAVSTANLRALHQSGCGDAARPLSRVCAPWSVDANVDATRFVARTRGVEGHVHQRFHSRSAHSNRPSTAPMWGSDAGSFRDSRVARSR